MVSSHLGAGDAELLMRLIAEARGDDPGEQMPWAVLEGLQRLVPCDVGIGYVHHDYAGRYSPVLQDVTEDGRRMGPDYARGADPDGAADAFWELWWSHMCSYPQRTGDLVSVIHTGDFFPSDRERLADPMREVLHDVRFTMFVSLPAPPGQARRILFHRWSGRPFDERDRSVVELLRPHLEEIWLDAERRRHGVPELTPREWQVLGMAAAGLSYAQIAHELVVSVGTVRKHMEHVRERLGVSSIRAAASLALPHAPAALHGSPGLTPRSAPPAPAPRAGRSGR